MQKCELSHYKDNLLGHKIRHETQFRTDAWQKGLLGLGTTMDESWYGRTVTVTATVSAENPGEEM